MAKTLKKTSPKTKTEFAIKARKVAVRSRLNFTPRLFGQQVIRELGMCAFVFGENYIYDWMKQNADGYTGGFWEFYSLPGGSGFFVASRAYPVSCDNYFDGILSAEAVGIVATLYSLSALFEYTQDERLIAKIEELKEYAAQLDESGLIFAAID